MGRAKRRLFFPPMRLRVHEESRSFPFATLRVRMTPHGVGAGFVLSREYHFRRAPPEDPDRPIGWERAFRLGGPSVCCHCKAESLQCGCGAVNVR